VLVKIYTMLSDKSAVYSYGDAGLKVRISFEIANFDKCCVIAL